MLHLILYSSSISSLIHRAHGPSGSHFLVQLLLPDYSQVEASSKSQRQHYPLSGHLSQAGGGQRPLQVRLLSTGSVSRGCFAHVHPMGVQLWRKSAAALVWFSGFLSCFVFFPYPGMKLPSRTPTHLDYEEEQKWNHTDEPLSGGRCCACPKTDSQLRKEQVELEYRKAFENYLHNEVFLSRYSCLVPEMTVNFCTSVHLKI